MEHTNILPLLSIVKELASAILSATSGTKGEPVPVCCENRWQLEVSYYFIVCIPDKGVIG
jgi:hypothetical protein